MNTTVSSSSSSSAHPSQRELELVASGLLACGFCFTIGMALLWPNKVGKTSELYSVWWQPRRWIYGAMWGLIYLLLIIYAVLLLILGTNDGGVRGFVATALAAAALFTSAAWTPVFSLQSSAGFAVSAGILVLTALLAITAAILSRPFLFENQNGVFTLGGVAFSIFSGWVTVAAGLNVAIATRAFDFGLTGAARRDSKDEQTLTPLILSAVIAAISIVFGNPIFATPALVALLATKAALGQWRIYVSLIIILVAFGASIGLLLVYRESGPWF